MRPFILAPFAHFSGMAQLRDVLQRVRVKVYEKAIPNIEDEHWKQNHKLRQDYTTYKTMMITVTLFLRNLGVNRGVPKDGYKFCPPVDKPTTDGCYLKLLRGEFDDTFSSPSIFFSVGRGLDPSRPWVEGRAGGGP